MRHGNVTGLQDPGRAGSRSTGPRGILIWLDYQTLKNRKKPPCPLESLWASQKIEPPIKRAAGDKDVTVVGGASTFQQCVNAGLCDEMHIGIMPVLLGDGLRLFDNIDTEHIELQKA